MNLQEYIIDGSPKPAETKRANILTELQSVFQPLRLISQYNSLSKIEKGNGERVMLFPGWKSHETVMFPIKNYLSKLGYTPEYWGLGFNNGQVEKYRDKIVERLQAESSDEKITLIGWSLGGVVAREIAREMPHKIASVVTYGTPAVGGPKYTIGEKFWDSEDTKRINKLAEELDKTKPIRVPMSIIFTKKDSIVAWPACLDSKSKNVKHYEVQSTHFSLGIDPEVWRIVALHLQNVGALV